MNNTMDALSLTELDSETAEVLPARELMCGGCCFGPSIDVCVSVSVGICL